MPYEAYVLKSIMSRLDIPTLCKVRKGWGTPCSSYVGEIKGWSTGPTLVAIALLEIVPSQVAR